MRHNAITFLEDQPGITVTGRNPDHPVNPSISWSASPSAEENGILSGFLYSDIDDEMVTHIQLRVNDHLSLDEAVAKFGLPPQVIAYEGGAEVLWLWLDVRYPDRGILVTHIDRRWQRRRADTVTLRSDLRISVLDLFASDRVETLDPKLIGAPSECPYVSWPGWDAEIEVLDLTE